MHFAASMNTHHQSYTLTSKPQTSPVLRAWAVLCRGTFSAAIFAADVALIVAMSCLTGVAYYLIAFGYPGSLPSFIQIGVLAASIFTISNLFRREYRLPNFFSFKRHARRTIQLWNVTLICLLGLGFLAQISVAYSRGSMILFYVVTLAALILLRYSIVRISTRGACGGPAFRAAHLPDRHRRTCRRLYQPLRALGAWHRYRRLPIFDAGHFNRIRRGSPHYP